MRRDKVRAGQRVFRPQLEWLEDRTLLNAGALDPTFGSGGVALNVPPDASYPYGWVMALQSDGHIVLAGCGKNGPSLRRVNSDGSFDSTFGADRSEPPGWGGDGVGMVTPAAVVIQPDGKILVAGSEVYKVTDFGPPLEAPGLSLMAPACVGLIPSSDFILARFNPDGTPDSTFGTDGQVITQVGSDDRATGLAIQPDGEIVLAGSADNSLAVVRYNPDGSQDTSFGANGEVLTTVGTWTLPASVALGSNGQIIVAGSSGTRSIEGNLVNEEEQTLLVRYNADGSLDSGFGNGGIVTADVGGKSSEASSLAVAPDGSLLVAGYSFSNDPACSFGGSASLTRFRADGNLDTRFGNGGSVISTIPSIDRSFKLGLLSNGQIVVAGNGGSWNPSVQLCRYNSDGSADTTFGDAGVVTTSLGQQSAWLSDFALQSDGSMVTLGYSVPDGLGSPAYVTLARFEGDGTPAGQLSTTPGPTSPPPPPPVAHQPPSVPTDPPSSSTALSGSTAAVSDRTLPAVPGIFLSSGHHSQHTGSQDALHNLLATLMDFLVRLHLMP